MLCVLTTEIRYYPEGCDSFYRVAELPCAPQVGWRVFGTANDNLVGAPEVIQVDCNIVLDHLVVEISTDDTTQTDISEQVEMRNYLIGHGWKLWLEGWSPYRNPIPDGQGLTTRER